MGLRITGRGRRIGAAAAAWRGQNPRMHDLLCPPDELQALPVPGAVIHYLPRLRLPEPPASLLAKLLDETPWRAEEITVRGKRRLQPRLTAWYGDPGSRYRYSGLDLEPLPWTETLTGIREAVERAAGLSFNSVLLNYYRDHRDSMGLHSDDEPALGPEPAIASLSLGETRTLTLKHRRRKDLRAVRIPLESGSLLLMQGSTQSNWKHGVAKQTRPCGLRVNLTFRRIVAAEARSRGGVGWPR